jgi:hypothetical protein
VSARRSLTTKKQTQSDPSRHHIGSIAPFLPSRIHHIAITCDGNGSQIKRFKSQRRARIAQAKPQL